MTLGEVITRSRERLDETLGSESQRYTTSDLTQFALDCSRWFVARTGCQYNTESYTQSAYQLLEDLPCDCIQVERVTWDASATEKFTLDATHMRSLDASHALWQRQTDTRSRAYFLLGLDRIALWPEATANGEDYTVHYQQDVHDTIAAMPAEYHEALIPGVVGRCLLAEHKVALGMEEYGKFRAALASYVVARSSVDKVNSMRTGR